MTNEKLYEAIGDINDKHIKEAKQVRKAKQPIWLKWGALAACLCLVVVGVLGGTHICMKQYVISNNITIYSAAEYNDTISSAVVTPEQADCLAAANRIHNTLSAQGYEWYGSCYYDFENDKIMVGLTEVSDSNKETVLPHTRDTDVQFYQCDYSFQYLEELYNKLDDKRMVLSVLGVNGFNISIEKNRVYVRIANAKKYGAIYTVNEMDSLGGAIVFNSHTVTAARS